MEQNVQKEILELRKAREEGMDKMTSDQMKAMTVKLCNNCHKLLRDMGLSKDEKKAILDLAHENQIFQLDLIRRLERCGFFDR